jgi:hypothetical protein
MTIFTEERKGKEKKDKSKSKIVPVLPRHMFCRNQIQVTGRREEWTQGVLVTQDTKTGWPVAADFKELNHFV